jgi:hypothetical protein
MSARVGALKLELTQARLIILFACAQLLDVGTTILGLRSGVLRQGNPVAARMLGPTANLTLAAKLLVGLAVMLLVNRYVSPQRRAGVLMILVAIALAAPAINGYQLMHARHLFHL